MASLLTNFSGRAQKHPKTMIEKDYKNKFKIASKKASKNHDLFDLQIFISLRILELHAFPIFKMQLLMTTSFLEIISTRALVFKEIGKST